MLFGPSVESLRSDLRKKEADLEKMKHVLGELVEIYNLLINHIPTPPTLGSNTWKGKFASDYIQFGYSYLTKNYYSVLEGAGMRIDILRKKMNKVIEEINSLLADIENAKS
ncbi:hypothetical protein [Bacillus massilinigeriensis]|uniref:hypothetical protein n=1 Tax=Bacillus mediterraneensis TaxID=1805474 RepID=UPI0008F91DC8|nr:hypothetical protein [Bacillus mediterraneensis]